MRNLVLLVCSLIISSTTWAMFCPSNFNSINIGDSAAQVQAACGKPDVLVKEKKPANTPQEWVYYVEATANQDQGQSLPQGIMQQNPIQQGSNQGSLKVSFAFDANGKVINASSNGSSTGQTSLCGGTNIQLGDTQEKVKAACGPPQYINESATPDGPPPPVEMSSWTYNSNPPMTLQFKDGMFTGVK